MSHPRRRALASVTLLVVTLFAVACGSDSKPPAAAITASPAADATHAAPASPSPAATRGALPSDVTAIVSLLNSATSGAQLLEHATLTPTECREELTQLSSFTKCPPGSHDGDFVPLFRFAACEFGTEPDVIDRALDGWTAQPRSLYAVIRDDPKSAYLYNWIPPGDYGVIYRYGEGLGILFTVAGGHIVGAAPGCASTPEGLLQTVTPDKVLLGPLPAN